MELKSSLKRVHWDKCLSLPASKRRRLYTALDSTSVRDDNFKKDRIIVDANLASSKTILNEWKKKWGAAPFPRLQPNIDLLYVHRGKERPLTASEVKFFYVRKNSMLNYPFYKGIEEALALLLFGFDYVSLLFVFEDSLTDDQIRQYGGRAWSFIDKMRGQNIDIDFACARYIESKQDFQLVPMNHRDITLPMKHRPVGDLRLLLRWKHPNPMIKYAEGMGYKELLLRYLAQKGL